MKPNQVLVGFKNATSTLTGVWLFQENRLFLFLLF